MPSVYQTLANKPRLWQKTVSFMLFLRVAAILLSSLCMLIAYFFLNFSVFYFSLVLLLACLLSSRIRLSYFISFSFLTLFFVFGLIDFPLFPQVAVLFNRGETLLSLFQARHMHLPRFLVAYPAMWCSTRYSISVDFAYTHYGIVCFSLLASALTYCLQCLVKRYDCIVGFLIPVPIWLLAFVMNGRLVPAFVGMSLILIVYIKKYEGLNSEKANYEKALTFNQCLVLMFGFFLTTVSSGTMMVSLLQIACCQFIYSIVRNSFRFSWVAYVGVFAVAQYVFRMLLKNISFFQASGNVVVGLLSHGVGLYFIKYMPLILVLLAILPILLIVVICYWVKIKRTTPSFLPVLISFPVCSVCGLFGLSTALMIVPSCILLIFLVIDFLLDSKRITNFFLVI